MKDGGNDECRIRICGVSIFCNSWVSLIISMVLIFGKYAGADPGFLERGFIYI